MKSQYNNIDIPKRWGKIYLNTFVISTTFGLIMGLIAFFGDPKHRIENIGIPLVISDSIGIFCVSAFFLFNRYLRLLTNNILRFFTVCLLIVIATIIASELSALTNNALFFHKEYKSLILHNHFQLLFQCAI